MNIKNLKRCKKGFFLIGFIILLFIVSIIMIPVSCHQEITRKQKLMVPIGIEMSYWDVFWIQPEVRINQGEIAVTTE